MDPLADDGRIVVDNTGDVIWRGSPSYSKGRNRVGCDGFGSRLLPVSHRDWHLLICFDHPYFEILVFGMNLRSEKWWVVDLNCEELWMNWSFGRWHWGRLNIGVQMLVALDGLFRQPHKRCFHDWQVAEEMWAELVYSVESTTWLESWNFKIFFLICILWKGADLTNGTPWKPEYGVMTADLIVEWF